MLGLLHPRLHLAVRFGPGGLAFNVHSQESVIFGPEFDFESVHKLFLVGQIHKPIAGGGGSHVGAL